MRCKNWLWAPVSKVCRSRFGNTEGRSLLLPPLVIALALIGCGGGSSLPPPPGPDFTISVSPSSVSIGLGGTTSPVTIVVNAQNGFTGSVNITLQDIPQGVTPFPSSSFSVATGAGQAVTFSVSASATPATWSIIVLAASGTLSHNGKIGLDLLPMPMVRTFDTGSMLVLETDTSAETTRVGLRKAWGASIVEVSLNGTNYVNSDDPGRQIQTSLWDGNANYNTSWGYNPIEAGDHFFQGSPVLASMLQPDSIYTKTQPIQWAPENFGGGLGNPVLGDAYIEKWISVVPGYNRVFKVHYKITHFGTDSHADALQELPVMYVNPNVSNFLYYGGDAPWTNGALSQFTMPGSCCSELHTPEQWGAYVDSTNTGIALYTPMQYPDSKGFNAGSTLQFTPACPYSWDSGSVLEFDTYILAGQVDESRAAIYALHAQMPSGSPLPALGFLDLPNTGDTLRGNADVSGWAWALSDVASVDVFVDGNRVNSVTYGTSRPDVSIAFPGAPGNVGFQYSLDTTKFSNGSHSIVVKATDKAGHVATFATRQVTVSN